MIFFSILQYGSGNMFSFFFYFHRSLTGQPPAPPDFPAPPPVELTEDTIETEVRTPVPENELVEDMDCTMLFPAAELLSEFASLI